MDNFNNFNETCHVGFASQANPAIEANSANSVNSANLTNSANLVNLANSANEAQNPLPSGFCAYNPQQSQHRPHANPPQTQPASSITTNYKNSSSTTSMPKLATYGDFGQRPTHKNPQNFDLSANSSFQGAFCGLTPAKSANNQALTDILTLASIIANAQKTSSANTLYNSFSGTQNNAQAYQNMSPNALSQAGLSSTTNPYSAPSWAFATMQEQDTTAKLAPTTQNEPATNLSTSANPAQDNALSPANDFWINMPEAQTQYLQSTPARQALKNYLQKHCGHLDADDINEVLAMAKELEDQAVAVFKAKGTHKTKLQEQNRQAISKLHTQSAHFNPTNPPPQKVYTRAEIGKMSIKEFLANQNEILSQHAKGAIL